MTPEYLRDSHTMEIAFPTHRGIHGTAALAGGSTSGSVLSSTSIQARSSFASRPV
jgi:hypothetical protein